MRIRVVETGEELDYRLAEILDDPRDRYCSLLPSISWLRTRLENHPKGKFHRPRRISVPPWQISASIGFKGAFVIMTLGGLGQPLQRDQRIKIAAMVAEVGARYLAEAPGVSFDSSPVLRAIKGGSAAGSPSTPTLPAPPVTPPAPPGLRLSGAPQHPPRRRSCGCWRAGSCRSGSSAGLATTRASLESRQPGRCVPAPAPAQFGGNVCLRAIRRRLSSTTKPMGVSDTFKIVLGADDGTFGDVLVRRQHLLHRSGRTNDGRQH